MSSTSDDKKSATVGEQLVIQELGRTAAAEISTSPDSKAREEDARTDQDAVSSLDDASSASGSDLRLALLSSAFSPRLASAKYDLTRTELWSYYLYYVGNSGLGPFNFAPSQFQNLLTLQASALAPLDGAGQPLCGGDGQDPCRLRWAGSDRTPSSIVLLANGISFAIQAFLFILLGSLADFGTFRPYILIVFTALTIGLSFAWLGTTDPASWDPTGTALYILGLVGYQVCLTFWTAAFPGLARCSPEVRQAQKQLEKEEIKAESFEMTERMQRNRIANMAFAICSLGELVILAVIQGMLVGIHADDTTESNTRALSAVVAFSAGAWALCALPWFIFEKHRPGQELPPGTNYITAGLKQAWVALTTIWQLKQSLLWLVLYFLLSDSLNTTVTVISTVQNQLVSFSTTKLNSLLIVGIAAQGIGIYGFWLVQKRWQISTLRMLQAVIFFLVLLQLWGFVGIFQLKFGFHNEWEAYAYQVWYGIAVCPWYAYGQTMISEFSPAGYEFLFFSLFSLVGKTSAFIGPFVSSAIENDSGNASMPFAFLLALTLVSSIGLFWLDPRKARLEQRAFLEKGKELKGQGKDVTDSPVRQQQEQDADDAAHAVAVAAKA